jgi:hypothetical protein
MKELDHVDRFLVQVDTKGTFLKVAELLSDAVAQDIEVRENLSAIRAWAQAQSKILSKQFPTPGGADILGSPAEATLLAVSYLRAQSGLLARTATELPGLKEGVANSRKLLDTLEPNFLSDLLIETERRASRDPMFADTLNAAKNDLRWLVGQLTYLPGLDVTPIPPRRTYQQGIDSRELSIENLAAPQAINRGTFVLFVVGFVIGFLAGKADGRPGS